MQKLTRQTFIGIFILTGAVMVALQLWVPAVVAGVGVVALAMSGEL